MVAIAAAGIAGVASIGSAVIGAGAAGDAADAQTAAANAGIANQQQMYAQNKASLQPYMDSGTQNLSDLNNRMNYLTSPITMDQSYLQQTPGYQFSLQQGLKSTQNSAAARGLGLSGAAQKGAANYATGLADSTYQNQFNNENTNRTNAYNRLYNLSNQGLTASSALAGIGKDTANSISQGYTNIGNAQAAADNSQGQYWAGAVNGLGNALTKNAMFSSFSGNDKNSFMGGGSNFFGGSNGFGIY